MWIRSKGTLRTDEQQYNAWLRASNERLQKHLVQPPQPANNFIPTAPKILTETTTTTTATSKSSTTPAIVTTTIGDKENAKISMTDAHQHIPTNMQILKSHDLLRLHLVEIDHDLNANDDPTKRNTEITAGTFNSTVENMEPCMITPDAIMVTSFEGTHVLDGPYNGPIDATQPATAQNQKKLKRIIPTQPHTNSMETDTAQLGSKRKFEDMDWDVDGNKKQKFETETWMLGKIFVEQLGSTVAATQHRQVR